MTRGNNWVPGSGDKRVHADAFKEGDLEWLHLTVGPIEKSKKLEHPWIGPYIVSSQNSLIVTTSNGWATRI